MGQHPRGSPASLEAAPEASQASRLLFLALTMTGVVGKEGKLMERCGRYRGRRQRLWSSTRCLGAKDDGDGEDEHGG